MSLLIQLLFWPPIKTLKASTKRSIWFAGEEPGNETRSCSLCIQFVTPDQCSFSGDTSLPSLILSHTQSARVWLGQTNPCLVCMHWKGLATWHPTYAIIFILELREEHNTDIFRSNSTLKHKCFSVALGLIVYKRLPYEEAIKTARHTKKRDALHFFDLSVPMVMAASNYAGM